MDKIISEFLLWTLSRRRTSVDRPLKAYINHFCAYMPSQRLAMSDRDWRWERVKRMRRVCAPWWGRYFINIRWKKSVFFHENNHFLAQLANPTATRLLIRKKWLGGTCLTLPVSVFHSSRKDLHNVRSGFFFATNAFCICSIVQLIFPFRFILLHSIQQTAASIALKRNVYSFFLPKSWRFLSSFQATAQHKSFNGHIRTWK